MRTLLVMVALVTALSAASVAQAGIWLDLANAVGKTVEDYNTDMLATGDAVNAALKERKLNDAFMAFDKNYLVTGEHALANSTAVYVALKNIVMWVPNQIKKLWEKFVAVLQSIRDKLAAMNQPPADPEKAPDAEGDPAKASSTSGGDGATTRGSGWMNKFAFEPVQGTTTVEAQRLLGLGDGFVEKFRGQANVADQLKTYAEYRGVVHGMQAWIASLKPDVQKALEPNFQKVASECDLLEDLLFEAVAGSIEGDGASLLAFVASLRGADKAEAGILFGSLADKVGKRLNMAVLEASGDANLEKLSTEFAAASAAAGLK